MMIKPSGDVYAFNRQQWLAVAVGGPIIGLGAGLGGVGEQAVFTAILGGVLLWLSVIDARHFILPNALNAALAAVGLVMVWRLAPGNWHTHMIGGGVGYVVLVLVEIAFRRLRGVDGLGRGDAKLLGAVGIWTGWTGLPGVLLIASSTGLVFAGLMAALGQTGDLRRTPIPFGPFLALGAYIVWLYAPLRPLF